MKGQKSIQHAYIKINYAKGTDLLSKSSNNAIESGSNISKICNTASYQKCPLPTIWFSCHNLHKDKKKRHKKEAKRNETFLNYQQEKIMHTGFVPPVYISY
jgi:hypothetical protein